MRDSKPISCWGVHRPVLIREFVTSFNPVKVVSCWQCSSELKLSASWSVVEGEVLDQVSEEVLVDPMQNDEVVRPVEVVDEEIDHVIDKGAHIDVVE